jgi:hypothetical protein
MIETNAAKPLTTDEKILLNTAELCAKMDSLEKNTQRQFFALIGVIMALIGQKLISTPWYIDLAVIVCLISGGFLAMSIIFWWKSFSLSQRALRIVGSTLMLVSSITQIFIYHPGVEPSPEWFVPLINGLLILLGISFFWATWESKPKYLKLPFCHTAR